MYFKRGRGKLNGDYKIKDFYNFYKTGKDDYISLALYKEIIGEFLLQKKIDIIENNIPFALMHRMGSHYIVRRKMKIVTDINGKLIKKAIPIDWPATRKLWEDTYPGKTQEELKQIKDKRIIYHYNNKTNGYKMHVVWDKLTAMFNGKNYYQFRPDRKFKNDITNHVLLNNNYLKYYEV